MASDEPVSVVMPNYNGREDIGGAIQSILASTYRPAEVLVIDDGSTDDSVAFIRRAFPEVCVIEMGRNSGGILNRIRNQGIQLSKSRLVFLLDHDVVVHPSALAALVAAMRQLPDAAVVTPRAYYHDDPTRIYVDAQRLHFLCNTVAPTRDASSRDGALVPKPSVGWGIQLIDKSKAGIIGFFDEDYVIGWGDDGEFHHKIHLVGLGCYSVPNAIVYHKRHAGADRFYAMIRNRWHLMVETYALRTLLLLLPVLGAYEIAMLSFAIIKGRASDYLRALRDTLGHLPRLLTKRARMQRLRRVPDRDLLVSGPIYIRATLTNSGYLRLGFDWLNRLFMVYVRLVRPLI